MNSQIINTVLLRQVLGVVAVAVTVVFTSSCGSNFTAKETESNNQERELALLKERSDQEKNKNDSFSIVHANICSFISNRFDDYYNTYGKSAPNTPAEAVERLKIISETIDKAQTKLDNAVATYSPLNGHNTKIEGDLRLRIESASASIKQSIADYSKFTGDAQAVDMFTAALDSDSIKARMETSKNNTRKLRDYCGSGH